MLTHISTRSTLTPHGSVASSRHACQHSQSTTSYSISDQQRDIVCNSQLPANIYTDVQAYNVLACLTEENRQNAPRRNAQAKMRKDMLDFCISLLHTFVVCLHFITQFSCRLLKEYCQFRLLISGGIFPTVEGILPGDIFFWGGGWYSIQEYIVQGS